LNYLFLFLLLGIIAFIPYSYAETITLSFTVPDTIPPVIIAPNNYATEATSTLTMLTQSDYGTATASDNIDPNPIITNDAPDSFLLGDTIITWSATDTSGNVSNSTQTVTIQNIQETISISAGDVSFEIDLGVLSNLSSIDETSITAENTPTVSFPYGLFSFDVTGLNNGDTATITIILPDDIPENFQYWKVINDIWVDATSLLSSNDGDETITLTITDGGFGDADGLVNGVISDPGGIAIPNESLAIDSIDDITMNEGETHTITITSNQDDTSTWESN